MNVFRIILFSIVFLLNLTLFGQSHFIFGDSLAHEKGIISQQIPDGTIWIVGSSQPLLGGDIDVVAVRIDTAGNILSRFTYYGGVGTDEYPNNMIYQNGNLIIVGEQYNSGDLGAFILVIDTMENQISFDVYGQSNSSEQYYDIKETQDGGFVVTGFYSNGPGNDFLISKFDASQQLEWTQVHDFGNNDIGMTVLENPSGGYIVAGDQLQPTGNFNVMCAGLDNIGNLLWDSVITNPNNGGCKQMKPIGNDILIVGEMSTATSSMFDIYLIKIDWQGQVKWQRTVPKTDNGDAAFDLYVNSANEILITGYSYSTSTQTTDLYSMYIDTLGNVIAEEYFHHGLVDIGYDIQPNIYGGNIVTGFTIDPHDGNNQFFISFSNHGVINSLNKYSLPTTEHIFLYPNPTESRVQFSKNIEKYELRVFDILGKEHFSKMNSREVLMSSFDKGVYIFQFTDKDSRAQFSERVVKK